jgi:hypothetical protein
VNVNAFELSEETLSKLFPPERADSFFEAMYGDSDEGAYDIRLVFLRQERAEIFFEFLLQRREGKCLACNLTYGLPEVFSRHPVIDLKGVTEGVGRIVGRAVGSWRLGRTREISRDLHAIPLTITLQD